LFAMFGASTWLAAATQKSAIRGLSCAKRLPVDQFLLITSSDTFKASNPVHRQWQK